MENCYIYNFRDLYEVQKQSKITNFFIQLNNKGLLGQVTNIRIKQIQLQEWLTTSPLLEWYHKDITKNKEKK